MEEEEEEEEEAMLHHQGIAETPSKMSPKVTRRSLSKMSNGRTTLEYRKACIQRGLPYVNYMRTLSECSSERRTVNDGSERQECSFER
uniref:Uncharacterized protein n=1 Tax=Vitis vinifera TaxID=29760 RepID=A5AMG9_VITVI|nr:hypothetical protein VITISV_033815 [Vitis vinifera]